jgi:hypothetical protein
MYKVIILGVFEYFYSLYHFVSIFFSFLFLISYTSFSCICMYEVLILGSESSSIFYHCITLLVFSCLLRVLVPIKVVLILETLMNPISGMVRRIERTHALFYAFYAFYAWCYPGREESCQADHRMSRPGLCLMACPGFKLSVQAEARLQSWHLCVLRVLCRSAFSV